MSGSVDDIPGLALVPPVLDSSQCIDAATDVGPMYLHRDDEVITPTLLKTGCWEPEEAAFLRTVLRPGGSFLDVGANIGYFSLLASAIVGSTGRVLAVEPELRNLDLLRANAWRNRAWNVQVLPVAAQAETGYVGLRLSAVNRGDHQVVDASTHTGDLVPAVCLDEVLGGVSIDVVKVDVQGVDHEVVEGLSEVVAQNPGIVLMCEFWLTGMEERGIDPRTVIVRYEELGFHVGLLGTAGSVSNATADEVTACCVGDNDFVNVVLTPSVSERTILARPSKVSNQPKPRSMSKQSAAQRVASHPFWWHSIDLGEGFVTPGHKPLAVLQDELDCIQLPDLRGKTVLDIGAWDGYFSFAAERQGASRVVALDYWTWATNPAAIVNRTSSVSATPAWDPVGLPGKGGFEIARDVLSSDVESVFGDMHVLNPSDLGQFDVVLLLGVLYHTRYPVEMLEKAAALTRGMMIVETESFTIPGFEEAQLGQFFETNELEGDDSNWWSLTEPAIAGMCRASGFSEVTFLPSYHRFAPENNGLVRHRAVGHATK